MPNPANEKTFNNQSFTKSICHARGFKWHVIKLVRVTREVRYLKYIPKYRTKLGIILCKSLCQSVILRKKDNYTL